MHSAISFDGVVKTYGDKKAVDHVSFDIESGTIVALLGPNGAGKTTAISLMLGLAKPSMGRVTAFGQNPTKRTTRKQYGVMLQQVSLPQKVRVVELIDLFRTYYEHPLDTLRLLQMSDLTSEAKKEAVKLSGGQQRRLQFALAMAGNPHLLFLDEPTTGMDVTARRGFWDNLREFAREGNRTIILTTHHLDEAEAMADRILLMQDGRVTADGSVEEMKRQAGKSYVKFVAGPQIDDVSLERVPGVEEIERTGRHVRLVTRHPDNVLRYLIMENYDASQFEVTQGHLEDAFISLTEASAIN